MGLRRSEELLTVRTRVPDLSPSCNALWAKKPATFAAFNHVWSHHVHTNCADKFPYRILV